MGRQSASRAASDEHVRALLERHGCPIPFHEVRTRFLGGIASPIEDASPMKTVADLWGGALPEFGSVDTANEVLGALVTGLWNRLTRRQDSSATFRLVRHVAPATRDGLAAFASLSSGSRWLHRRAVWQQGRRGPRSVKKLKRPKVTQSTAAPRTPIVVE